MKETIAVSICLLGAKTRYDGLDNFREEMLDLIKDKRVVLICPEVFSGMQIPRIPSERINDKVFNKNKEDVTLFFNKGAEETLNFLKETGCKKVYLKDGSPSCGVTYISDGTFSHKKKNGMGVTTELLVKNGIEVIPIK